EFRRKDGTVMTGVMSARVMQIDGEPCILSLTRDISERKQIEDDIRRLNAELEERVQERTEELTAANEELIEANILLEEATRAKDDFLASMSHELRTPLNSIIGFTGVLLQGLAGPINAEQDTQLRMVSDSGRHLLSLIDDILDLSKIESGMTTKTLGPVDVYALTDGVLETLRPQARAKGIELASAFETADMVVDSDPRLLSQILLNLVGNAVKFTDEGRVLVTVARRDDEVVFAVSDTGRGVRPADMPHIMERFYQAEPLVEAKHEGTGLGLAICSSLAEILGGSLTCTSEFGVGSTFTVHLPASAPPNRQ
ncbi:MAG: ATP-binding protein, partial [Coriobacteriia bacterium]|nr:ATP-binding protein [Coriobacteriia bacterium]